MAVDLLKGFQWDAPLANEEKTVSLTVRELIILMALNQDYGIPNKDIPGDISMRLQEKLKEALD